MTEAEWLQLVFFARPQRRLRDAESSGESRQPQFQWHNRAAPRTIRSIGPPDLKDAGGCRSQVVGRPHEHQAPVMIPPAPAKSSTTAVKLGRKKAPQRASNARCGFSRLNRFASCGTAQRKRVRLTKANGAKADLV